MFNCKFTLSLLSCLSFFNLLFAEETAPEKIKIISVENVYRMDVNGSINPATKSYLGQGFKKAAKNDVDLILISMNTPGGLVTTTKDILQLFGESEIPVAMWVRPQGASATSAGAILASGSHLLYMSEGTNMGAATPVQMGGDIEQEDARNKAVNDLVALVKSLAEAMGRDAEGFELMISEGKSFTASEALEKNLINGIVNRQDELWPLIDGSTVAIKGERVLIEVPSTPRVETIQMDPGQLLLNFFANPITAYILFLLGAALLYFEFQSPGGFIAGGLGLICLLLAGIGFQVLPLNVGALTLICLGFIFFLLELYITSYGIFSIAGIISLITGSLFLYRTEDSYIEVSTPVILSSLGGVIAFIGVMIYIVFRDQKNVGKEHFNDLSHRLGQVTGELPPVEEGLFYYQVKVSGEIWKARSKTQLNTGDRCRVIAQDHRDIILDIEAIK